MKEKQVNQNKEKRTYKMIWKSSPIQAWIIMRHKRKNRKLQRLKNLKKKQQQLKKFIMM